MDFSIQFAMNKCTFTIASAQNGWAKGRGRGREFCEISMGYVTENAIPFILKWLACIYMLWSYNQ